MFLKISSPTNVVFEGKIEKMTIPTENGDITILNNHTPLVSSTRPGLVKIRSNDLPKQKKTFDFIGNNNTMIISISKGIVFIDGKTISLVVSSATTNPSQTPDELSEMKISAEQRVIELKQKGSIEEVEKQIITLQKIKADLELSYMKHAK